jgi:hypothetical protein
MRRRAELENRLNADPLTLAQPVFEGWTYAALACDFSLNCIGELRGDWRSKNGPINLLL